MSPVLPLPPELLQRKRKGEVRMSAPLARRPYQNKLLGLPWRWWIQLSSSFVVPSPQKIARTQDRNKWFMSAVDGCSFEPGSKAAMSSPASSPSKHEFAHGFAMALPLSQSSKAWFETVRGGLHVFAASGCFKLHRRLHMTVQGGNDLTIKAYLQQDHGPRLQRKSA